MGIKRVFLKNSKNQIVGFREEVRSDERQRERERERSVLEVR